MVALVVREDPVEFAGTIVSVSPPLNAPVAGSADLPPTGDWIVVVTPDPEFAGRLVTRNGVTNPAGNIVCTVTVDNLVIDPNELLLLLSNSISRHVRIVGTWCDDDDTSTTVIFPLGVLAAEYDLEIYDIGGWPVAVRDIDLFGFAQAGDALAALTEPHVGESRTLTVHVPFPFQPSDAAVPFARAYASTRIDQANALTLAPADTGTGFELAATIETGAPADGKGFFYAQVGLTFDEPDLDNFCPPGTCDVDGEHCAHQGLFRFSYVPAQVPYAQKGDLALSPGDGQGFISGIVASLDPPQVYDHMGMFTDNGHSIRHCTSSQDRLQDDELYTAEITVKLAGIISLDHEKVPLNGLRPDLVRFGWPGSITQTVEEVYRTGRNTLNEQWTYASTHPGQDLEDPERSGVPFRIYQLPRADRQHRLEFNDPERTDKSESVVRLQDTSVLVGASLTEFKPMLVRPHPQFDAAARPLLALVADTATKLQAHYRFFAYTRGSIGIDPAFTAPPADDASWGSLPAGARWAAGTVPGMCSSFLWTAVQLVNRNAAPGTPQIVLEDRADPPDPASGLEYGTFDGLYQYHAKERHDAGTRLVAKIGQKIRDTFDAKVPGAAYTLTPALSSYRDLTASRVSNQMANAFATDACDRVDDDWSADSEGETASPDDVLDFWDLKPHNGALIQPEGGLAVYGDSVPLQLTAPRWLRVPLFRKQDVDLGTGRVTAVASVAGVPTAGVTVRIDSGCETLMTTDSRKTEPMLELGVGTHFADAFIVLPNPATGNPETFRTPQPVTFQVQRGQVTQLQLNLEPPPDLWRIVDVHLDADIHDRSFWGGDADHRDIPVDRTFELRQDLDDDPQAPSDQQSTVLHHEEAWRTEPEVGSGVHVAVALVADFDPADRSVRCHCEVALIDTDSGGFLGIGTSSDVDQLERRDVVIAADQFVDVLTNVAFASDETVPERATVSLRLTNRRRPS